MEQKIQSRFHATPRDVQPVTAEITRLLEAGEFQTVIANHAAPPGRKPKEVGAKKTRFRTQFHTRRGATCANRFLEFKTVAWNSQHEKPIAVWKTFTGVPYPPRPHCNSMITYVYSGTSPNSSLCFPWTSKSGRGDFLSLQTQVDSGA